MTKFSFILPSSRQLLCPLESWRIPFQILHPAFLLLGPKQGRFEPCYSSRSENDEKNRIDDNTNNQNIIADKKQISNEITYYLWDCKKADPGQDYECHRVKPTEKR